MRPCSAVWCAIFALRTHGNISIFRSSRTQSNPRRRQSHRSAPIAAKCPRIRTLHGKVDSQSGIANCGPYQRNVGSRVGRDFCRAPRADCRRRVSGEPHESMTDVTLPPRLGRRRWLICALLFFATTINYADRRVLGLLAPPLQVKIGWDEKQYAYIGTAFFIAYAIGLPLIGRFIDRVGTRTGYATAIAIWSLAAVAHSLVRSALGFGIVRFALGLGESGNFPAAIKTVAELFPKKNAPWLPVSSTPGRMRALPSWAFLLGKFLTDPIWRFFLFWLPKFFSTVHGVSLTRLGLPLVIIYNCATVGSVFGGWLPARFLKAGLVPESCTQNGDADLRPSRCSGCARSENSQPLGSHHRDQHGSCGPPGVVCQSVYSGLRSFSQECDCLGGRYRKFWGRDRRCSYRYVYGFLAATDAQLCPYFYNCRLHLSGGTVADSQLGAAPAADRGHDSRIETAMQ